MRVSETKHLDNIGTLLKIVYLSYVNQLYCCEICHYI